MSKPHSSFTQALETLIANAEAGKLDKNEVHYTPSVVCNTPAGYYIGTWCIEFDVDTWIPQPNSRDSEYMSMSEADAMLKALKAEGAL